MSDWRISDLFKKAADRISGSLSTLDIVHKYIHDQRHYILSHSFIDVPNNGSVEMRLKSNDKFPHSTFLIHSAGDAEYQLYVNSTYIADGTEVSTFNNVITSANIADSKVYHTPTIDVLGTSHFGGIVVGGTGGQASGGSVETRNELVVTKGADLLLRITNVSGQTRRIIVEGSFYE